MLLTGMPAQMLWELIGMIGLVSSFCGLSILIASLTFFLAVKYVLASLRGWANNEQ